MIGIVGGAGPLAGVDLMKKIIEETVAQRDQDHVPVMLLSVPENTPDRTAFLLGEEQNNPAYPISELFLHLEKSGATVAAIPCNTAHAQPIFGVVKQALRKAKSRLRLLNLIEETVTFIKQELPPGAVVGVLSTTGTRKAGIYRLALQEAGLEVLEPDDRWQDRIHAAIYDKGYGIKAHSSPVKPLAVKELTKAMDALIRTGANVIVLGCTEIPLAIMNSYYKGVPMVDPNRILARALIRGWD